MKTNETDKKQEIMNRLLEQNIEMAKKNEENIKVIKENIEIIMNELTLITEPNIPETKEPFKKEIKEEAKPIRENEMFYPVSYEYNSKKNKWSILKKNKSEEFVSEFV